jgi:hypothetical protein
MAVSAITLPDLNRVRSFAEAECERARASSGMNV